MKYFHFFVLTVALGLSSGVARGDDASAKEQARAYFKTGVALAQSGELGGALEAFQHAYDTSPHYAVLYNLGRVYEGLGRSVDAVRTFERFLNEGRSDIEASRRNEVEATLVRLRAGLGRAELDVSPPEAEVFLDGARLGNAPVSAQDAPAGEHVVAARLPGLSSQVEIITLTGGETTRLSIALEPMPPLVALQPPPAPLEHVVPPPIDDTRSRRYWALGVGIGGVALASAAIATFAWNSSRYDDWRQDRANFEAAIAGGATGPALNTESADLRNRAVALQRVDDLALGMGVAAGCALVTSAVLWLTTLGNSKPSRASVQGGR